jgi:predicted alpha/beta hydrolase family esterase
MSTEDKVLILHGWGGSDAPHWQAELAGTIAKAYGTVSFPLLDNCHFPSKNRWVKQLKEIQMIVSDNDPYIKIEEAQMMAEHYAIHLEIIKNGGHINADSGYGKWGRIEQLVMEQKNDNR